jgi:hypothetical protein
MQRSFIGQVHQDHSSAIHNSTDPVACPSGAPRECETETRENNEGSPIRSSSQGPNRGRAESSASKATA